MAPVPASCLSLAGSCQCSKLKHTPSSGSAWASGAGEWGPVRPVLPHSPAAAQQHPSGTNTRPVLNVYASFVRSRIRYCLPHFNCQEAWATLTPTYRSPHRRASVATQLGSLVILLLHVVLNILPRIHSEIGTLEVMMVFSKLFDKFIRPRQYVQGLISSF